MTGICATGLRGHAVIAGVFAFCFGAAGCGPSTKTVIGKESPPQHIAKLFSVWVEYERANKKPAASANDLKSYIERMPADQLERMQITDKKDVFISPRDQQPYVVQAPRSRMAGIVLYEKTGQNGKHMAASSTGAITELSETELNNALGK